jgi:hypothetical protein
MRSTTIRPQYAIIFRYDVRPETQETYFRYVIGDFTPALQEHEIYMQDAWHVAWGDYPERQLEYVTERFDCIRRLLQSPEWERLEGRLKSFTKHYSMHIQRYTGAFKV